MLDRTKAFHDADTLSVRQAFCEAAGLDYRDCVYQLVSYNPGESFREITPVTARDVSARTRQVHGDGLFTDRPGVGLFLPVADCVATVVYDPKKRFLALLHLGRHATYANLSTCAVRYFTDKGSSPEDLIVWLGPHAGPDSYSLEWFDRHADPLWQGYYEMRGGRYYVDLAGYNVAQFIRAGIMPENITVSDVDTMTNDQYFSHATGDTTGRIAVVAMMQ